MTSLLLGIVVLTNHLGYDVAGPKRAVVQGQAKDSVSECVLIGATKPKTLTPQRVGPVAKWRDWRYWTVDFSSLAEEGEFVVSCATSAGPVRSFPFRVQKDVLERHTLSDVLYYFKGQRSSGPFEQADRRSPVQDRPGQTVDARGGWYDATGDYGKHLSHLSFSTYFNPQQAPLTVWGLLKTQALLEKRGDKSFKQYLRRALDEAAWGADFLVRMKAPAGSFYRSVSAPGPGKLPQDRRIAKDAKAFALTTADGRPWASVESGDDAAYQTSFRAGAGVSIAALARAAAQKAPGDLSADYLRVAEEAWAFLSKNNTHFTNDGKENIVDDYCALLAATELYAATKNAAYRTAADLRAKALLARVMPGPRAYFRADDGDRPFFHAVEAGLPVVSLLEYGAIADAETKAEVLKAVRASLEWELAVTAEVANPFGYARQLVQRKTGERDTRFFIPHDTDTAPWWQGENARLGSMATAARLALPHFADDPAFAARLRGYAVDQLDWILGRNPFDASMLDGTGRNNPEYFFFGSYEYMNAPGGIVNGITAGFADQQGIDFNVPQSVTGGDHDWRWAEQWLPHDTWYMLAVAAGL
jgi:hypothetical protein